MPARKISHRPSRLPRLLGLLAFLLAACHTGNSPQMAGSSKQPIYIADPQISARQLEAMGRQLFFEPGLSASGRQSCASCHDPAHAYGPANGQSVQMGGLDGQAQGNRAVPSLRYLQQLPPFSEHYRDNDGNDSEDAGPTGGLTWDGRAASLHQQAAIPLLASNEMANDSPEQVIAHLQRSPSAAAFSKLFGPQIFRDSKLAFSRLVLALEVFQQNPAEFYPYDSKYDEWLRGKAVLSAQELRGLKVFNDPDKGNCASCHLSQRQEDGSFPAFTDFGLIALGVPRNRELAINHDGTYFDLGLCGPLRQDMQQAEYCGLFRTPSLRNVASRKVFFHNGAFHDLRQVLEFYASRDTQPGKWYPHRTDGSVALFDDLPLPYQANINRDPPFGGKPGQPPAFGPEDIDDMLAFLQTLNDADVASRQH